MFKLNIITAAVKDNRLFWRSLSLCVAIIVLAASACRPSRAAFEILRPQAEDLFFPTPAADSSGRIWGWFTYGQRFGLPELSINRGSSGVSGRQWSGSLGWSGSNDELYRESRIETSASYRTSSARLTLAFSINSLTIKGFGSETLPGLGFSAEIRRSMLSAQFGGDGLTALNRIERRLGSEPAWWGLLALSPMDGWRFTGWFWTTGRRSPSLHLGLQGQLTPQAAAGMAAGGNPERLMGFFSLGWGALRTGYLVVWHPRLGLSQDASLGLVF